MPVLVPGHFHPEVGKMKPGKATHCALAIKPSMTNIRISAFLIVCVHKLRIRAGIPKKEGKYSFSI
jgi:hypothetical protein